MCVSFCKSETLGRASNWFTEKSPCAGCHTIGAMCSPTVGGGPGAWWKIFFFLTLPLFPRGLDSTIFKEFLEVHVLHFHKHPDSNSFFAPTETHVNEMKDDSENTWHSSSEFLSFIQKDDKHQLGVSAEDNEESCQIKINFMYKVCSLEKTHC